MTWHYEVSADSSELRVWDHTQDPATETPLTTAQNDGSGFTLPGDVLDVMRSEADAAQGSDITRWRNIHIRMAHGDVEGVQ